MNDFLITMSIKFRIVRIDRIRFGGTGQQTGLQFQVTNPAPGCFVKLHSYSHSIVPVGFGVRSYSTRFTPGTSVMIRWVM